MLQFLSLSHHEKNVLNGDGLITSCRRTALEALRQLRIDVIALVYAIELSCLFTVQGFINFSFCTCIVSTFVLLQISTRAVACLAWRRTMVDCTSKSRTCLVSLTRMPI